MIMEKKFVYIRSLSVVGDLKSYGIFPLNHIDSIDEEGKKATVYIYDASLLSNHVKTFSKSDFQDMVFLDTLIF